MEGGDFALDAAQPRVEFVFRQVFQDIVAHDVTGNEFRRFRVNGNTGIVGELLLLVELPQRHAFRGDVGHDARRHHLVGFDIVQFDDVLDYLVFAVVQHAFLFADVGHGAHFFTRDGRVRLLVGNAVVQFFDNPDDGIEQIDQKLHHL